MSYKEITLIGDSIASGFWDTEGEGGWYGRLEKSLARRFPAKFAFENLAHSGDRTFDLYHRLHGEVLTRRPDTLIISGGVNDLIRWNDPDEPTDLSRGVRLELWEHILTTIKANDIQAIVVGILPCVEERMPASGIYGRSLYYKNEDIQHYDHFLKEMCEESDVPYLELFDTWINLPLEDYYQDASHPNSLGHEKLTGQIEPFFLKHVPPVIGAEDEEAA